MMPARNRADTDSTLRSLARVTTLQAQGISATVNERSVIDIDDFRAGNKYWAH